MISAIEKLILACLKVGEFISATMLAVGVSLNFVNIFCRYFLHFSISWAEEIMLDLMLGVVFFGAGMISLRGRHIRMDLGVRMFPASWRPWIEVLADIAFLAVAAQFLSLSIPVVVKFAQFGQLSDAAKIPVWIPHGFVPAGIALMTLATLLRILQRIVASRSGVPVSADEAERPS